MASDYRLSPALGARLVGGLLIAVAALVLVTTLVVAILDLPLTAVLVVGVVGVLGVLAAGHLMLHRVPVVRLGEQGYRVRMVRGAGVRAATWREVEDAVTATPRGIPCVVLRLRDGRTTTIPAPALAADREAFVRDLRDHLQRGQGLRPWEGPDSAPGDTAL